MRIAGKKYSTGKDHAWKMARHNTRLNHKGMILATMN
jgi:hypothetical protein